MTIVSTPHQSDFAMQKDLFRFSATLFAETSNEYSTLDSQLQMIKCVFLKVNNEPMSVEEIAVQLLEIYKYHISEEEIEKVVKIHKKTFETVVVDGIVSYRLLESVLTATKESQKYNIDSYIADFICEFGITESEVCSDAIYGYLYELTTTNINTYKLWISGEKGRVFSDSEVSVNLNYLSKREQQYVHDFVAWDNGDKNIALSNIVFMCLEYCLLVNGDKPNRLLDKTIRQREVYLDTNIIFRALGINGPTRQKTVRAFLGKCRQARLDLVISYNTKKEFFDTVEHYIDEILRYPRGNVCSGAYEQLSDYTLFNFYEEWRKTHPGMSMIYFKLFVQSTYEKMVEEYSILDAERIPREIYDSEEFKQRRNAYSAAIKAIKDELQDRYVSEDDRYSIKDSHDATVVRYVEMKREDNPDKDLFFVSSDKILRYWDLSRPERVYPVVIYPSQLFLVLIKVCGRSENDFDSFVNFINVRSAHHQMPAEKANVIISGISTITEDISTQQVLISAICSGQYQDVLSETASNDELYVAVQEVSKRYLEEELKEKESQIFALQGEAAHTDDRIASLEEQVETQADEIDKKDKTIAEKNQEISEQQKVNKEQQAKINAFVGRKVSLVYGCRCFVVPALIMLVLVASFIFICLQISFREAEWNFAIAFFGWLQTTWFGERVGDLVYVIDAAIVGVDVWLIKKYMRNPFDKAKNRAYKTALINEYIEKNGLS